MSGNGQNQLPGAHGAAAAVDVAPEDDDDFGDFEGFEGGVERMQAQPAPSPWATFPDLLPVTTSPATPAEDAQAIASRNANASPPPPLETWQPAPSAAHWLGGPSHEVPRPMPQQMRTLNPPDVSLGTNQAVGGRVTPDNVHDAALAVVMDHLDGGVGDPRLPVAQIDRLNQQLENAEHNRVLLEEQVDGLQQRNLELEQQVASSQAQINDLHSRLQRNQESLEQRLSDIRALNNLDWRPDFRLIQEEIAAIKQAQIDEKNELQTSRQNLEDMRTRICDKLQTLESNIQHEYVEMERRLSKKFDDQCNQVKEAIEAIVQQTAQQISGNFSQLLTEAVQNSHSGGHGENNLLQSIKVELEKHKDQQKRVLEEERQRQLITVSSALQSALQHLNSAITDNSKHKDHGGVS